MPAGGRTVTLWCSNTGGLGFPASLGPYGADLMVVKTAGFMSI